MEKNKPSEPHLDENLINNQETNDNELPLTLKETIAKNKKIIEKNRQILRK
ncbi:multidrug transporter [Lysinibacillus sp. SGAir0095]|nr:multidrug transporter [Lysinibacillus sp. SGAir0095]